MLGEFLSALFSMQPSAKGSPAIVPARHERQFHVGDRIVVYKHFWTHQCVCLGFDTDARHGHQQPGNFRFGGSVWPGDVLEVLSVEDKHMIVKVHKDHLPHGAPCPHGMIFIVDKKMVLSWPKNITVEEARWDDMQSHTKSPGQ